MRDRPTSGINHAERTAPRLAGSTAVPRGVARCSGPFSSGRSVVLVRCGTISVLSCQRRGLSRDMDMTVAMVLRAAACKPFGPVRIEDASTEPVQQRRPIRSIQQQSAGPITESSAWQRHELKKETATFGGPPSSTPHTEGGQILHHERSNSHRFRSRDCRWVEGPEMPTN